MLDWIKIDISCQNVLASLLRADVTGPLPSARSDLVMFMNELILGFSWAYIKYKTSNFHLCISLGDRALV